MEAWVLLKKEGINWGGFRNSGYLILGVLILRGVPRFGGFILGIPYFRKPPNLIPRVRARLTVEVLAAELEHRLPLDWPNQHGTVAALAQQPLAV